MNTSAIKKMEIINSLSLVPGTSLDKIKEYIDTLMAESKISKPKNISFKGIWKDKGFDKIYDIDAELKTVRHQLENTILKRKC